MVKWGTHCHAILQHFYPPHIAYQDAFKILLEEMGMWMRNIHDVRDHDIAPLRHHRNVILARPHCMASCLFAIHPSLPAAVWSHVM